MVGDCTLILRSREKYIFNQIRAYPTVIIVPYPMTMWVFYSTYPQIHSCMSNNRSICYVVVCMVSYVCVRVISFCTLSGFVLCISWLLNKCRKWQQTCFCCTFNLWLLQGTRCVLLHHYTLYVDNYFAGMINYVYPCVLYNIKRKGKTVSCFFVCVKLVVYDK